MLLQKRFDINIKKKNWQEVLLASRQNCVRRSTIWHFTWQTSGWIVWHSCIKRVYLLAIFEIGAKNINENITWEWKFILIFLYNLPDNGKAETILAISDTIWLTESNGFCFHKAAARTGQCSITFFKCSVKSSKFKQFIFVMDNIFDLYRTIFFFQTALDDLHLANKSGRVFWQTKLVFRGVGRSENQGVQNVRSVVEF